MYKDYNMTQLTLPLETSVLIPTNDMSRHVNDIVETFLKLNSMNSDIIVVQPHTIQNDVKSHSICLHTICVFRS